MKKNLAMFFLVALATFCVLFSKNSTTNEASFDEWRSNY